MRTIPSLNKIDTVTIFKTRFHKLTVKQLLTFMVIAAKNNNKKTIIGHVNIRGMNFAYELPWYRDFVNNADLVYCDGFGVLFAGMFYGYPLRHENRMCASDYIEDLALACEAHQISLFLLAGIPGVVDKSITRLKAIAPNLRVEGHHGYFAKHGVENEAVIQKINEFRPDILYIGFGMPLQERWILDNMSKIDTNLFLPLGACLDFFSGITPRGPRWMTDRGLEWVSRLFTEPRRLWRRYLIGNFVFYYRILLHYWTDRVRRR